MLAKRIIPCLDVDAGRVVKGVRFQEPRDAGDPVELAQRYDAEGADELVFLDITATVDGRAATHEVISRTADDIWALRDAGCEAAVTGKALYERTLKLSQVIRG